MCQSELYTIPVKDLSDSSKIRDVYAVDVLDCLRGEEVVLLCGAVLGSTLRREGEGLTGRYFAIKSGDPAPGKRYRQDQVVALERTE